MSSSRQLTRPSQVRALLREMDFHPSRVLGQNFLIDRNILNILLDAAQLIATDRVLEVGPGLGVLTGALLEGVAAVIAIEKDRRLAAWLRQRFDAHPKLTLIEDDALDCDLPTLLDGPGIKLVANLPYAIAARLMVRLTELPHPPARMVVTIQREVADRLVAAPSTRDYGLLTILMQRHYAIQTVKIVSRTCFWPPPAVQSAIVSLERRPGPLGGATDEAALRDLLRHVFSQRRKTLARILRDLTDDPSAALAAVGLPPATRPEEVPPETWPALNAALN